MAGSTENRIAQHYAQPALERSILEALAAAGKDIDRLEPADLAPVDELHIGGPAATAALAGQMDVRPGMHLLDIGSGLGGASRYFAREYGCRVTGIDLTTDYVDAAAAFTRRLGLQARIAYHHASALALPFADAAFDGAYMIHVGMNIEDKAALFAGVRRVVKKGGVFALYEVMREQDGSIAYPTPWAASAATSFVETVATYRRLLEDAGFSLEKERNRRAFAIEFFRQMRARQKSAGRSPLGPHLVLGPSAPQKIANTIDALERGVIAPVELVCRAV